MKTVVDAKRAEFGEKNVRFYRLVKGSDVVASVPPKMLGFDHMVEPTRLADDGNILEQPRRDEGGRREYPRY